MNTLSHSRSLRLSRTLSDEVLQDICEVFRMRFEKMISAGPKVSVVFPAYNEERYLPVMLHTLSQIQTDQQIEVIGVDNGSSDRTAEIIRESGIKCLDEPRKGVSYARQSGLLEARGEYVFSTDADTLIPKKWVDANLKYFQDIPNLVCFSGGSRPQGVHWSFHLARSALRAARFVLGKEQKFHMSFPGHNMVFRRDVALKIGGYEPGSDLGEDNIIARKMRANGNILQINHDPEVCVTTSARRFGTFPQVARFIIDRFSRSTDYSNLPTGLTFRDVR